ncbi:hypothetical protein [uncultured Cohaesibacter sp.]|uniref:hypothetical protein n=1 Tax=uncultured Cohaesibacter sp. TaxID=1002546 RepID=UPI00292DEAAD|nr:hypothetical protein [uncultured Cohaesibacter sp.]
MQNTLSERLDRFFIEQGSLSFDQMEHFPVEFGNAEEMDPLAGLFDDDEVQIELSSVFQPFTQKMESCGVTPDTVARLVRVAWSGIERLKQPEDRIRMYDTLKALLIGAIS